MARKLLLVSWQVVQRHTHCHSAKQVARNNARNSASTTPGRIASTFTLFLHPLQKWLAKRDKCFEGFHPESWIVNTFVQDCRGSRTNHPNQPHYYLVQPLKKQIKHGRRLSRYEWRTVSLDSWVTFWTTKVVNNSLKFAKVPSVITPRTTGLGSRACSGRSSWTPRISVKKKHVPKLGDSVPEKNTCKSRQISIHHKTS